jgi:hypothetical protein
MRKTVIRAAVAALMVALATPAMAQFDVTGEWGQRRHEDAPERGPGPDLGDYAGLPVNAAAVLAADTWTASRLTLPEYQCRPHPADYSPRGPANLRIWETIDRNTQDLVSYHTHISWMAPERTIWMDGRPHPSEHAAHTWGGFSTGVWEGNMLTVTTTHLKPSYLRRNGLPASAERTFTEHWVLHGNYLSVVTVINDPVFLTEPLVRTQSWVRDPSLVITSNDCEYVPEVLGTSADDVPHYLPGQNPYLREWSEWYGVPYDATRGGAETMYPEYRELLPQTWSTLDRCERYCRCFNGGFGCGL